MCKFPVSCGDWVGVWIRIWVFYGTLFLFFIFYSDCVYIVFLYFGYSSITATNLWQFGVLIGLIFHKICTLVDHCLEFVLVFFVMLICPKICTFISHFLKFVLVCYASCGNYAPNLHIHQSLPLLTPKIITASKFLFLLVLSMCSPFFL